MYIDFKNHLKIRTQYSWLVHVLESILAVSYDVCTEVVHRHGARTLWTPMDCWKATPTSEPEMPHFECRLVILVILVQLNNETTCFATWNHMKPLANSGKSWIIRGLSGEMNMVILSRIVKPKMFEHVWAAKVQEERQSIIFHTW